MEDNLPDSKGEKGETQSGRKWEVLLAGAIGLLTLLAYARTFHFEFVYDDHGVIEGNPSVLSGGHFWGYFSSHAWQGTSLPVAPIYYRPLLLSWFRLNYMLFGLQPVGWHVSSVLLHVMATLLVYAVSRALRLSPLGAAMAALVFGLHPQHIETATWISGAADSMYAIFALASFLLFLRWFHKRSKASLAGSLGLFAAGTLCKESAIVFPAIVSGYVLFDVCRERASCLKEVGRKLSVLARASAGYVAVAIGYFGLRQLVLGVWIGHSRSLGWGTLILTWPKILCFYLWNFVHPVGLREFYDVQYASGPTDAGFYVPLLVLLILGSGLYAWARRNDTKIIPMACIWFLVPLLPTLDLNAFTAGEFVHDRFLYLSMFGFCLLLGLGVEKLQGELQSGQLPTRGLAACSAAGSVLLILTIYQTGFWKDDLSLFSRAHELSPHNRSASINLAAALGSGGRLREAKEVYLLALRDWPMDWTVNYNYGYLCYLHGDYMTAEQYLARAIEIFPNNSSEHFFLGLTWNKLGFPEKAQDSVRKAIELNPKGKEYHLTLGALLLQGGNEMGACVAFRKELDLDSTNEKAAVLYRRCNE